MKENQQHIIVATQGFVYVGIPRREGEFLVIGGKPKNIRVWGTDKGLGQLLKGPRRETVLDDTGGEVLLPWHSVVSLHPCTGFDV